MSVGWIFPGQGAQSIGMGRKLYQEVPAAREVFEQASAAINVDLAQLCFDGPDETLTSTENAQPAILTVSVAVLRALEALSDGQLERPVAVAGHSLGEYSALVAAGALDLETAVRLVRRRGELMAAAREGTMSAVIGLDVDVLDELCRDVSEKLGQPVVIANYNAPSQLVMSGATSAVQHVGAVAKEEGASRVVPLKVSAAFHSPLMVAAAQAMDQALSDVTINDLSMPLIGNVQALPIQSAAEVRPELVAQIISPVHWIATVQYMVEQGISTFAEIGPGGVLTGLVKRIAPDVQTFKLRDVDEVQGFLSAKR